MIIFKRVYQVEVLEAGTARVTGYFNVKIRGDGYDAYEHAKLHNLGDGLFLGRIWRVK